MNDKDGEKDDNEHKEYVLPENSRLEETTSKSLGKPSSLIHNSEKRPERKRMFSKIQKQQDAEAVKRKMKSLKTKKIIKPFMRKKKKDHQNQKLKELKMIWL